MKTSRPVSRRKIPAAIYGTILFLAFAGVSFAGPTMDYGPKYLSPTEELVTPHITWLKPYSQGPLKILFITYQGHESFGSGAREVVELAQRMDLDYKVFQMRKPDVFWVQSGGPDNPSTVTLEMKEKELKEKLEGNYDLIILGKINWSVLPLVFRYEILKKTKEGAVLLGVVSGKDEYLESAMKHKIKPSVSFLFPYKGLPAFSKYADLDALLNATLEVSSFGKGKIILLKGYGIPYGQTLTPGLMGDPLQPKMLHYDYYLAYIIHLMAGFALDKEPEVRIAGKDCVKAERNAVPAVEFLLETKEKKKLECLFTLRDDDNKIIKTEKKKSVVSGSSTISFAAPKLTKGNYFADLLLKEDGKTINFGSSFLEITSDGSIEAVENIRKSYRKEEEISGKVIILTKTGEDLKIKITREDNFGRVVDAKIIAPEKGGGKKEYGFLLSPITPLTIVQYLDVELIQGKEVLDKKRIVFTISNLYPKDDIRYVLWIFSPGDDYLYPRLLAEVYKAGFDTQYTSFTESSALANLYHISYITRFFDEKQGKRTKDDHVRVPCLTDPAYLAKEGTHLTKYAEIVKPFSSSDFSLGDEGSFVVGPFELCFSPTCVAKFRQFLKNEYGTLQKLNEEYESGYASFDEVTPVTLEDVKKNPKLIPLWVDYRRHMESVWAGLLAYCNSTIQKVVPEARVGYEGYDNYVSSYAATDLQKTAQEIKFNSVYDSLFAPRAIIDLARPGSLLSIYFEGGYNCDRSVPFNRYIPWRHLFRGANSFWIWHGAPGECGGIFAPDFSMYEFFKTNVEQMKEIKNGTGKLLICSKKENNGIGLLYSSASIHSSTLAPSLPRMEKVLDNLTALFEDTTSGFQVISYKQVEEGILDKEHFRIVFLPFCQSLSMKEAGEISRFVEKGGVLVADIRPGVSDEHGKPWPGGILDKVFGVEQNTKKAEVKKGDVLIEETVFPKKFPETSTDASLKLTTGQAKARIGEIPAFIVNNYGQGKAVLLNFSLSGYVEKTGGVAWGGIKFLPNADIVRDFFKALLSFAGLKEEITVTPEIPGLRKYAFTSGDLKYFGILQELPEAAFKYATGEAKPLFPTGAAINLAGRYHVYNIREGKYCGYSDKIKTPIEPAKALLYSLLPYKVAKINLTAPKSVRQGDTLKYEVQLFGTGTIGLHVFHLSLINPEGREVGYYSDNLKAEAGKVEGEIPLCLNETPGKWRISAKDVATGMKTERTFLIQETTP